jgi:hypothetical protein
LPEAFGVRLAAGFERFAGVFFWVVFLGAAPLLAAVVREEPFLLAPPRWEVFATQLPFSPNRGYLDLRDPARKLLADKGVEDSHS